jgi:hypothetical protein
MERVIWNHTGDSDQAYKVSKLNKIRRDLRAASPSWVCDSIFDCWNISNIFGIQKTGTKKRFEVHRKEGHQGSD